MHQRNIQKLLPDIMQRTVHDGSILETLLGVMAQLQAPSEQLLSDLHTTFNPHSAPAQLLPMLAHWMDLLRLFQPEKAGTEPDLWQNRTLPTDAKHLRNLIANATFLSKWRGTHYGLLQTLRIATGLADFTIDDGTHADSAPNHKAFHIVVTVPHTAEPYLELIDRIVAQDKPVYTTYQIQMALAKPTAED